MPNNGHDLTPEDRLKGGQNSKRKPLDQRMQDWLEEELVKGNPDKGTIDDALRQALIKYGLKGNIPAIKEIYDRAYGRAPQHVEHGFKGKTKSDEMLETLNDIIGKPEKKAK